MVNNNVFTKICSKIDRPYVIYKVIEWQGGMDSYELKKYFYEDEDAYKYLRSRYITILTKNLEYFHPDHDKKLYDTRDVSKKVLNVDRRKMENIYGTKFNSRKEKEECIYDEILEEKVKKSIKIAGGWHLYIYIEVVDIE